MFMFDDGGGSAQTPQVARTPNLDAACAHAKVALHPPPTQAYALSAGRKPGRNRSAIRRSHSAIHLGQYSAIQ